MVVIAAAWRYWPLMPNVFFGDDLFTLLSLKDGQCGGIPSQLLTTTCQDKFRPVAFGFEFFLLNLFDTAITHYLAVNILLHAVSATLVFVIAYRLSKNSLLVALSIGIAFATSRFAVYQVTQMVGGAVEGVALILFLGVIYSIIRADNRQENPAWWGWIGILLSFFLIHCHERYIVIFAWLGAAFVFLPNFQVLPKKQIVALVSACVAIPVFNVAYKIAILHTPFLLGTDGTQIAFDFGRTLSHLSQAIVSIAGFNEGPEYLVAVKLTSLPWYPAWILASTLAITLFLSIFLGVSATLYKQNQPISTPVWTLLRWPILLIALALLLLIPPISTIRLEQRWLLSPFILILLVSAWAVGKHKNKYNFPIQLLIVILAASSILIDSVIVKHFNQVFFVSSARFAEMAKRDIVDKYPGQLWDIDLASQPNDCVWSLQNGGFFRIYGGQARKVKCVTLNDIPKEAKYDSGVRVFSERSSGHLSDITNEWQSRLQSQLGKVSFDFIKAFPNGNINNSAKVGTPTGSGVLILDWPSVFGIENTMTIISGFSYRFDNVLIEPGAQLRFGLSMIYPAEPARAVVYVVDNSASKQEILFSREISSPLMGEKLNFSPISLSMAAYTGKRISLVFAAEPTGSNTSGQWLGYSNPRFFLPAKN